jgi:hypothetical protein
MNPEPMNTDHDKSASSMFMDSRFRGNDNKE